MTEIAKNEQPARRILDDAHVIFLKADVGKDTLSVQALSFTFSLIQWREKENSFATEANGF